jgi:transketolase
MRSTTSDRSKGLRIRRQEMSVDTFPQTLKRAKARLLRMHFESGVGHIAEIFLRSISFCTFITTSLRSDRCFSAYQKVTQRRHLYTALWSIGRLTDDDLRQFHRDVTR